MMIYQHSLVTLLEKMRHDKSISLESFLDGITSQRSYYRYLKLENEMPMDVLIACCDRLDIKVHELIAYVSQRQTDSFYLSFAIRFHRLRRETHMQRYLNKIQLDQLTETNKRYYDALKQNSFHPSLLLEYPPQKMDHLLTKEYYIELGYQSIKTNHRKDLMKAKKALLETKDLSKDYYLNYVISLFNIHMAYLEKEVLNDNDIRTHLSGHLFYDAGIPFKTYVEHFEKIYLTDTTTLFKQTIISAFK